MSNIIYFIIKLSNLIFKMKLIQINNIYFFIYLFVNKLIKINNKNYLTYLIQFIIV